MLKPFLLSAAALLAIPCQAATVVSFANPDGFTDAANQRWEVKSTLDALAAHMKKLGERYIAPDETLTIEVLDVDLAGWARFGGRAPNDYRTVRGRADFPSMKVRYTLDSSSRKVSGEETLSDLSYTDSGMQIRSNSEPYYYEKRMLDHWFKSRFSR